MLLPLLTTLGIYFAIAACSFRSTGPTVQILEKQEAQSSQKTTAFSDFWEAMENLDLAYPSRHSVSDDQRRFVQALEYAVQGNVTLAEDMFRQLYRTSDDSLVKHHAGSLLHELLFYQSKWDGLLDDASPSDSTAGTDRTILLIQAFSQSPPEEYTFPERPVTLPIKLSLTGSPVIEVTVNGSKKRFWIDTGAGLSAVASDVAEACHIRPIGTEKSRGYTTTSKQIDIQPAIIEDLKIGTLNIKNHPVIIIDKKDLEFKLFGLFRIMKIDGIIGWNAIQNIDLEVDYENKTTTIGKPIQRNEPDRSFFWLGYPIVQVIGDNGTRLNFGLDTGARRSSIRGNIFKKISAEDTTTRTKRIGGAGGFEQIESKVIPELTIYLKHHALHFKKIGTNPMREETFVRLDGVLGSDISKKHRLKIDITNGRCELR